MFFFVTQFVQFCVNHVNISRKQFQEQWHTYGAFCSQLHGVFRKKMAPDEMTSFL